MTNFQRRNSIQTPLSLSKNIKKEFPLMKTSSKGETHISYFERTEKNEKYNLYMEDIVLTMPNFTNDKSKYLFGIFDGHGGDSSAKLTKELLPKFLQNNLKDNPINIEHCMELSFKNMDQKAKENNFEKVGNTATLILINTHNHIVYCSNVGDSTCMIVKKDNAVKLSYDDKCSDEKEKKRIEKDGGQVIEDRLNNILAISRSIGDFDQKGKGLISTPHFHKHNITKKDKFIVLASDGVWDIVNGQILYTLSREVLDNSSIINKSESLCNKLVDYAIQNGSQDNISCVVVYFE